MEFLIPKKSEQFVLCTYAYDMCNMLNMNFICDSHIEQEIHSYNTIELLKETNLL